METDHNIIVNVERSFNLHFKSSVDPRLTMFIEGQKEDAKAYPRFELRIDGPHTTMHHEVNDHYFEVNALITSNINQENLYQPQLDIAEVYKAFKLDIPLLDGDSNQIGCIKMVFEGRRDVIEVNRFGKIHQDKEIYQASIEAHYIIEQS